MYPTAQTAGGRYQHIATIWDRGVETQLTVRKIEHVLMGPSAGWGFSPGVSQYDEEVVLPMTERVFFYVGEAKFLSARGRQGIFTGKKAALRTITISRSGPLPLIQGQITYQTIAPSEQLMEKYPQLVTQRHPSRRYRMYPARRRKQFIHDRYPLQSEAWRYIYERWFLFDPDRLPDHLKGGQAYLGHTRLGIDNYTAEAMVAIRTPYAKFFVRCGGYCGRFRFLHKFNPEAVYRLRRGVTASMALRDTVLLNTKTQRPLQVRDVLHPDGTFTVGQLASN